MGKWVAGMRVVRDGGRPVGFGWSLLRDTVCRLLYVIPFMFLIDSPFPLGRERRSVRDKIVHTNVVKTAAYRSRRAALIVCALLAVAAWTGVSFASGPFDQNDRAGADGSAPYTRSERLADCASGGGDAGRCRCIYDELTANLSAEQLDALETADPDGLSAALATRVGDAQRACA